MNKVIFSVVIGIALASMMIIPNSMAFGAAEKNTVSVHISSCENSVAIMKAKYFDGNGAIWNHNSVCDPELRGGHNVDANPNVEIDVETLTLEIQLLTDSGIESCSFSVHEPKNTNRYTCEVGDSSATLRIIVN